MLFHRSIASEGGCRLWVVAKACGDEGGANRVFFAKNGQIQESSEPFSFERWSRSRICPNPKYKTLFPGALFQRAGSFRPARKSRIDRSGVDNDGVEFAGAVNAADEDLLDVGGAARAGDQDHGTGLFGGEREDAEQFIEVREDFAARENGDVDGGQERNQARFLRA